MKKREGKLTRQFEVRKVKFWKKSFFLLRLLIEKQIYRTKAWLRKLMKI